MMSDFSVLLENSQYPEKCLNNTVEPLINGHIGNRHFVFYREVILSSDIEMYILYSTIDYDLKVCPYREVVISIEVEIY